MEKKLRNWLIANKLKINKGGGISISVLPPSSCYNLCIYFKSAKVYINTFADSEISSVSLSYRMFMYGYWRWVTVTAS